MQGNSETITTEASRFPAPLPGGEAGHKIHVHVRDDTALSVFGVSGGQVSVDLGYGVTLYFTPDGLERFRGFLGELAAVLGGVAA